MKINLRRWSLIIGGCALAVAIATAIVVLAPAPVAFQKVKQAHPSSELLLVDRDGAVLQEIRHEKRVRRLNWTPLTEIPEHLKALVLKAEDKRFYQHFGVDLIAFAEAARGGMWSSRPRGASTISMQVAEMIESQRGSGRRNWRQKLKQIHAAIGLEQSWSKTEILEVYFNLLYFRGELQGIGSAAQGLFGKAPFGLSEWESAAITALIRAPNASADRVIRRSCRMLNQELCQPPVSVRESLIQQYSIRPLERIAPHVQRHLPKELAKGRVVTSLRRDLQLKVRAILAEQVRDLRDKNLTDAAAVVLDNATGEVLAYVANVGLDSVSPHVDAAMAQRQAGSTLKPFIYGLAMERRLITPATVLPDTPTDVAVATGLYRPSNYDRRFRETVSARVALASSLNIPAVKVLEAVGVEPSVELLTQMGFTGLQRPDFYGPSLALGSMDVRLLELTNAYRALANEGRVSPVSFIPSHPDENQFVTVLSPEAAYLVGNVLADRGSRGVTFGWENALGTRFWSAVKTGTSKDMRDNWCIGYSRRYTVGVWAGNLTGAPMWNVSGVQGAAPAWLKIMTTLHEREGSEPPSPPPGVVQKIVRYGLHGEPFTESFLDGTEPPGEVIQVLRESNSRLLYPVDQTLVALDPDIPVKQQRIFFSVKDPLPGQTLRLNGRRLGSAHKEFGWTPRPGRFRLELLSQEGQVLDQVHFQVRGHQRVARN